MPSYIPPLPGLTRYTWWGAVPEGLLTKTQLDRQSLKPGSDPVGQVLYHGNCYAPLYEMTAAVAKRTCSPAQRAALDRARELQHECRRCGVREDEPLGKGRYCDRGCRHAMTLWEQHDQAQALARELVADPASVLLVVDVERDALPSAQVVAVVGVSDHQVLYTATAGEYGTPERGAVLDRLDALLADRRVVEEPDHMGPPSRYPHRLISQPGQPLVSGPDPQHPWAAPHSSMYPSVARIWSGWFAWTDYPYSTVPSVPRHGAGVPWGRSLDVAEDGRSMAAVLHRIADGTEPVWERAAWTVDGHGIPTALPSRRRVGQAW